VPDDLLESDPIDVELFHDGLNDPPIGAPGAITLTFPLQPGQSTPMSITGSGYILSDATPELSPGTRLIRNVQIKFDGKSGPAITKAV